MRKITICTVIVFVILSFTSNLIAQDKWQKGKLVSLNGDTTDALVCMECSSIWKVKVKINNKASKIEAKYLKSVVVGEKTFESLSKNSGYYFFERLTYGEVPVFEQSGKYYTSNKNLSIFLSKGRYKNELLERIDHNSELYSKIQDETTTYNNFVDVIKKYNENYLKSKPSENISVGREIAVNGEKKNLLLHEDSLLSTNKPALFKIGFDGISLESKIFNTASFYSSLGVAIQYYHEFGNDSYSEFNATPFSIWQIRFYNFRERIRRSKSIYRFSGNYFAPSFIFYGDPYYFYGGGLIIGNQKISRKGFYTGYRFGLSAGGSDLGAGTTIMIIYGFKIGLAPLIKKGKQDFKNVQF